MKVAGENSGSEGFRLGPVAFNEKSYFSRARPARELSVRSHRHSRTGTRHLLHR